MPSLVLGTAQWGSGYGVTNTHGRPSDADIADQVTVAKAAGVSLLDTAAGYGDAQFRIRALAPDFSVTTKVAGADPNAVANLVRGAVTELGDYCVEAVLLHDWDALDVSGQRRAAAAIEAVRDAGLTASVGVSVYDEGGLTSALASFTRLDVVQLPANVLDRRLDGSPAVALAREAGVRLQVRSALLQGLLAAPSSHALSQHPDVQAWFAHCAGTGRNPISAALAHVRALPWCDDVVVGVTSANELRDIMEAWKSCEPQLAPVTLATQDLALIDPRRWKDMT